MSRQMNLRGVKVKRIQNISYFFRLSNMEFRIMKLWQEWYEMRKSFDSSFIHSFGLIRIVEGMDNRMRKEERNVNKFTPPDRNIVMGSLSTSIN